MRPTRAAEPGARQAPSFLRLKPWGHRRQIIGIDCRLHLHLDGAEECRSTGIEMLLADSDATISLTPEDNQRLERRHD